MFRELRKTIVNSRFELCRGDLVYRDATRSKPTGAKGQSWERDYIAIQCQEHVETIFKDEGKSMQVHLISYLPESFVSLKIFNKQRQQNLHRCVCEIYIELTDEHHAVIEKIYWCEHDM